ncbi:MMPL family transporter [Yinghuangia soli]|uniref:MMPL family transporter n=1 Tax=Yinghuangia soli TaxID=2908204 RepID=A0AA41U8J9_9ACTN|nr:MMPL family transporter [Yinghuangia soli]MCF2532979.1 MMPL family transporter [Yinghuangia soli]
MARRRNLAASMGGWSARNRKTAVLAWLLFVVLSVVIGSMAGSKELSEGDMTPGEAGRAEKIIEKAEVEDPASEMLLVTSTAGKRADDPAVKAAVADILGRLQASGKVENIRSPYDPKVEGAISEDGTAALAQFDIIGKPDDAVDQLDPIMDAIAAGKAAHPEVKVAQLGDATSEKWFSDTIGKDFKTAEWTAVPLALGILLIAFGAIVAALLPVVLALTAFIAAGIGLLALATRIIPTSEVTMSVMLLIGLAVGVDYCLFYIRREREERAKGRDPERALEIAAATSGRSVLISGITVMVAMAGMLLTGLDQFQSMALGTILVVFTAMLGSVTVLPALLSMLGDKVDAGKIPGLGRMRRPSPDGGKFWGAILGTVLKRPLAWTLVAGGLLIALTIPAFDMKKSLLPLDKELPKNEPIVQTYKEINAKFPGGPSPQVVVVKAPDINAADFKAAVQAFRDAAIAKGIATDQIEERTYPGHTDLMSISVPFTPGDDVKKLKQLRSDVIPGTLEKVKGVDAPVTGDVAGTEDFNAQLDKTTPIAFGFVLLFAFLLMLVSFRSLNIAITAIVLNLLSVGAAYGVLTLVFQHGYGDFLVGTDAPGAITSWLPLFLFVVLFGLSMDYHVFVVSRIREAYDKGMSTNDAVAHGVRSTAGVVTSAAVIMVAVFAVFGTLSMQQMKQMGVGLAVAVLLDATIIRAILLPAVMGLLGDRNWYLPKWLGWLPQMDHGSGDDDDEPKAAAPREPVLAGRHAAPYHAGHDTGDDIGWGTDVSGSGRLPKPPVG